MRYPLAVCWSLAVFLWTGLILRRIRSSTGLGGDRPRTNRALRWGGGGVKFIVCRKNTKNTAKLQLLPSHFPENHQQHVEQNDCDYHDFTKLYVILIKTLKIVPDILGLIDLTFFGKKG